MCQLNVLNSRRSDRAFGCLYFGINPCSFFFFYINMFVFCVQIRSKIYFYKIIFQKQNTSSQIFILRLVDNT